MIRTTATLLLPAVLLLTCAPISTSSFSMAYTPLPAFAPSLLTRGRVSIPCTPRACFAPLANVAQTSFLGSPSLRGSLPRPGPRGLKTGGRARGWTCLLGGSASFDSEDDDDASEGGWSEYIEDEDWEGDRMVVLRDTVADRVIECFIDRELEVEGKRYATLMPADTPVILAAYDMVNGTEQLVPVLNDADIDRLFDTAAAVLAEVDLALSRSAVVLTVEGGMVDDDGDFAFDLDGDDSEDELSDEDGDEDEDEDEPQNFSSGGTVSLKMEELVDTRGGRPAGILGEVDSEEEDDEENEKVQVLATFFFEGKKHVVAAPLEPVLIIGSPAPVPKLSDPDAPEMKVLVGELAQGNGGFDDLFGDEEEEYHLPGREELERVTPIIERELENMHESEVQEKRKLLNLRASLQKQWNSDSKEM